MNAAPRFRYSRRGAVGSAVVTRWAVFDRDTGAQLGHVGRSANGYWWALRGHGPSAYLVHGGEHRTRGDAALMLVADGRFFVRRVRGDVESFTGPIRGYTQARAERAAWSTAEFSAGAFDLVEIIPASESNLERVRVWERARRSAVTQ